MSENQLPTKSSPPARALGSRRKGAAVLEVADRRITMAYRPHPAKLLAAAVLFTFGGLFFAYLGHVNQSGATHFYYALAGISIGMVVLGLAYVLPQLFIHRRIVLDAKTITLPVPGFTTEHRAFSAEEIIAATIYKRRGNPRCIRVRTERGTFTIHSNWLGAKEDFFAVQVWVRTHVKSLT